MDDRTKKGETNLRGYPHDVAPGHAGASFDLRPFAKPSDKGVDKPSEPNGGTHPRAELDADALTADGVRELIDDLGENKPAKKPPKKKRKAEAARNREIRPDAPTRDAARKRRGRAPTQRELIRQRRRKKAVARISALVAALFLVMAGTLVYFLLLIDAIEIRGCERTSSEQILQSSGLKTGMHLWLARLDRAAEAIKADPYIKTVEIARVYPDKLVITISERHEAAVIMGMNTQAVVDEQGYVLFIGARAAYEGLIRVYGTAADGYQVNQHLGEQTDFHSRTLVALLGAIMQEGLYGEIDSIDISNPLSIFLVTREGLKVQMGQPDAPAAKLEKLKAVLPTLRQMGDSQAGTLDVSANGDPVYSPKREEPSDPALPGDDDDDAPPTQTPGDGDDPDNGDPEFSG